MTKVFDSFEKQFENGLILLAVISFKKVKSLDIIFDYKNIIPENIKKSKKIKSEFGEARKL